jgi:hypothetical protein
MSSPELLGFESMSAGPDPPDPYDGDGAVQLNARQPRAEGYCGYGALMLPRSLDTALTAGDGLLLGQCLTGAGMTDRDRSIIAAAAWLK